ncbi:MAG TPA: prolipoprotein diacylglyceryl transferase [Egibacteraceae bacterium]|nr:prolipoprotein diacylglyceryl transferase [Egibacteraceae bacterium]
MSVLLPFAVIPPPPGDRIELGPFTVHYYGIAIAIGALIAVTLLRKRFAARGGDPDLADRTAVWAVAAGLLGARLAYVSTHLDRFMERPWAILAIWEGGLAFFGGLTFGALAAILYLRRHGASVADFADAAAPALPLAHAIGRWGNYFNEELYGTPTDVPWALDLSFQAQHVHPTFLYESLLNLTLAGTLLLADRGRALKRGTLVFLYLAGYGVIRFSMELLRTDTEWRLFGLSRNAYVALLVVLIGLVGARLRQRAPEPEPEPEEHAGADHDPSDGPPAGLA